MAYQGMRYESGRNQHCCAPLERAALADAVPSQCVLLVRETPATDGKKHEACDRVNVESYAHVLGTNDLGGIL